jgi:hypothetical protein
LERLSAATEISRDRETVAIGDGKTAANGKLLERLSAATEISHDRNQPRRENGSE